jgi:hypothetical protein
MSIINSLIASISVRPVQDVKRVYAAQPQPAKTDDAIVNADGDRWEPVAPRALSSLSDQERAEVEALRKREREVRRSESAKLQQAKSLARGPVYSYEVGPDGNVYAVDGEVIFDMKEVPGDPQRTAEKMSETRLALMAVPNPGPEERRLASEAARKEAVARAEIRSEEIKALRETITAASEEVEAYKQVPSAYTELAAPLTTDAILALKSFDQYKVQRKPSPEYAYRMAM